LRGSPVPQWLLNFQEIKEIASLIFLRQQRTKLRTTHDLEKGTLANLQKSKKETNKRYTDKKKKKNFPHI
jgi:hypothetical protein